MNISKQVPNNLNNSKGPFDNTKKEPKLNESFFLF